MFYGPKYTLSQPCVNQSNFDAHSYPNLTFTVVCLEYVDCKNNISTVYQREKTLQKAKMPPMKLQNNGGGGDVSDGNVSGAESDHSNTSRENDVGRDSSEDEADSDESSDMDEGECENRRNELLQHVQDLESQFSHLREQLYKERMAQVMLHRCYYFS